MSNNAITLSSFSSGKAGDGRRLLETKRCNRLLKVNFPSVNWFKESKVPEPGLSTKLALLFSIRFIHTFHFTTTASPLSIRCQVKELLYVLVFKVGQGNVRRYQTQQHSIAFFLWRGSFLLCHYSIYKVSKL